MGVGAATALKGDACFPVQGRIAGPIVTGVGIGCGLAAVSCVWEPTEGSAKERAARAPVGHTRLSDAGACFSAGCELVFFKTGSPVRGALSGFAAGDSGRASLSTFIAPVRAYAPALPAVLPIAGSVVTRLIPA